ncbi:hypothetical protein COLO4_13174 [Corchorus olitorius]|uniref:Uncharacterized protein n=1 Tax=Corchorus olitorius TaxID=93759 RepID=A0A1R3JXQ5_9ROSI|nr:hypothetical protein COLO4_13174 [Corchorus olitorius]
MAIYEATATLKKEKTLEQSRLGMASQVTAAPLVFNGGGESRSSRED